MKNLVCAKLKEIVNLADIIKTDEPHFKSKHRKVYNFSEYSLSVFLRDIHERYLSLEDANDEQNNCAAKLKNLGKVKKQLKKSFFQIT